MPEEELGNIATWDSDIPEIVYVEVDDNNIATGGALVVSAEDAPDEATGQTFCRNLLNTTYKYMRAYKTKPSTIEDRLSALEEKVDKILGPEIDEDEKPNFYD